VFRQNGFTPLHITAQEGYTDLSSVLLENHADVNFASKNGLTPLHLAAESDRISVAEIFVKHNVEIDPRTKVIQTILKFYLNER